MAASNGKRGNVGETRHVTARIDTRLVEILEARAKKNDRSVSAEIRQILRNAFREEAAA